MSIVASKRKPNYTSKFQLRSKSSQHFAEEEGSAHSTNNRYRALDDGHSPSSRIDPLNSTTVTRSGGRPYLRRQSRVTTPVSDLTHHGRKLEAITIETTLEGEIGSQGVMFDVKTKTKETVRIKSFTFHSHSKDECNVKVFTKRGTHRSFEENSAAWTNIVNTTMECKGPGTETKITSSMFDPHLSDELIIKPDIGRAIYIDSNNAVKYSLTDSEDEVFAEDSYVQIFEGTGLSQEYGDLHSPRMWNGILTYELLPGCEGILTTPSNDSQQSYGHMFNIGSNYPGGIIIDGIEFYTHKTTKMNYEIYSTTTNYIDSMVSSNWTLDAEGSITGGGKGAPTAIVGNNFKSVRIKEKTSRSFYITLDTQDLRYAESSGKMGEIFVENNHIFLEVGVGVADYPMREEFFLNRQWCGRVFYRTINQCTSPISVNYVYEVQYSKDLRGDPLLEEIDEIVNSFVENFLNTNSEVKSLEKDSGNPISLMSTETETTKNGGFSSSCASTNASELCSTLKSIITLGNLSPTDTGDIEFLLLQQDNTIINAIGEGDFIAKNVGDKLFDIEIQLVLQGAKSFTMGSKESTFLEEVIFSFLNKNVGCSVFLNESSCVKVFTVRVIKVSIPSSRLLIENKRYRDSGIPKRNLDDEKLYVTVDMVISGKYRPLSDTNVDSMIEDTITSKTKELMDELELEPAFFTDLKAIAYRILDPISPSLAPSQTPISGSNDDGGISSIIWIVIIISVVAVGLVAVSYVMCRIVRNKRKGEVKSGEEEPALFEEQMLDDWSQNSEDNVFGKKFTADEQNSGKTAGTASSTGSALYNSSTHTRDIEREYLATHGMHDAQHHAITRDERYADNKSFHDNHMLPSYNETDNNSIISGRSGRSGRTGRTGKSSIRAYSPSGQYRASSRRTRSPSGRLKVSSRRTRSPSITSKASSRRTHSPSGQSRASSRRTHSPSGQSRTSSRRTHSPSGQSRESSKRPSSRRTRSPSGRVASRRTHSPMGDRSIRSTARTADYGEGSVYSNRSAISSKGPSRSRKTTSTGYAAVHGHNPPARRKKISGRSFTSENEDEERAGFVRMTTGRPGKRLQSIPSQKYLSEERLSRKARSGASGNRDRLVKSPSDEISMASDSTNSSISTKGSKIPGKSYY